MAAKDYVFATGCLGSIYLTKKTKPRKNGMSLMSNDRRELSEDEILFVFESYLRDFCQKNHTDTLNVTVGDGRVIFVATLKDKNDLW